MGAIGSCGVTGATGRVTVDGGVFSARPLLLRVAFASGGASVGAGCAAASRLMRELLLAGGGANVGVKEGAAGRFALASLLNRTGECRGSVSGGSGAEEYISRLLSLEPGLAAAAATITGAYDGADGSRASLAV